MDNQKVNREFRQFGDRMYYMLILMILNFIPVISIVAKILMLYFSIKILGDIDSANKELKKKELEDFRSYFISSYVLIFVMGIILLIAMALFVIAIWPIVEIIQAGFEPTEEQIIAILPRLILPGVILLIGLLVLFIVGLLRYSAWGQLNEFFIENASLFPEAIAYDARKGAEYLKNASLCMILFFLIITIPIGIIYEIMGYIKLAKLRYLEYSSTQVTSQPSSAPPPQVVLRVVRVDFALIVVPKRRKEQCFVLIVASIFRMF